MARATRSSESPTLKKYRELLGVTEMATVEELKRAYHARAFLYHPDRNADPQAPAQFQQVREAFDVLSNAPQVQALKQNHLKERLFNSCVEGLQISFGAFFGYRVFVSGDSALPKERRLGVDPGPDPKTPAEGDVYIEEDRSILDDPAYDSIEVVYAGKFSEDEEKLLTEAKLNTQAHLPWVVLNNKGIIDFLAGDFSRALKCYEELNARIPNNIIFMYREALCQIVLGFKNPETSFWGRTTPNKSRIRKGVQLLKKCIRLGETRPVGKQKCVVIRKFLADVLEKTGRKRSAKRLWKDIHKIKPKSVEAALKVGENAQAKALLARKTLIRTSKKSLNKALLSGRSK